MQYSLTYVAVLMLAFLGVENAEQVVEAILIIVSAAMALYGRYRAGGISAFGFRL